MSGIFGEFSISQLLRTHPFERTHSCSRCSALFDLMQMVGGGLASAEEPLDEAVRASDTSRSRPALRHTKIRSIEKQGRPFMRAVKTPQVMA